MHTQFSLLGYNLKVSNNLDSHEPKKVYLYHWDTSPVLAVLWQWAVSIITKTLQGREEKANWVVPSGQGGEFPDFPCLLWLKHLETTEGMDKEPFISNQGKSNIHSSEYTDFWNRAKHSHQASKYWVLGLDFSLARCLSMSFTITDILSLRSLKKLFGRGRGIPENFQD